MLSHSQIALAQEVQAVSLEPKQHRAPRTFRVQCDCYLQTLIKFPYVAEFHSYAEWLQAGLCEGDPQVTTFIPQPFRLRVQGKRYIPDLYLVKNGQRRVIELKPRGEFDEAKTACLAAFFAQYDMVFEVHANEDQLHQEQAALNWLTVVRTLVRAEDLDTQTEELQLMQDWPASTALPLSEWLDPGNREHTYLTEIALFRLAHRGWLCPNFASGPLDYETEFTPCPPGATH